MNKNPLVLTDKILLAVMTPVTTLLCTAANMLALSTIGGLAVNGLVLQASVVSVPLLTAMAICAMMEKYSFARFFMAAVIASAMQPLLMLAIIAITELDPDARQVIRLAVAKSLGAFAGNIILLVAVLTTRKAAGKG